MHDFDFIAWVKTKPANEPYDYASTDNCAYAQFLKETGRAKAPIVGGHNWNEPDEPENPIPQYLRDHTAPEGAALQAGTFGGILARLNDHAPQG